ncbi:MAG: hypothetical protein M1830_007803 [Pleopsidium flavum]|nr:MAG: hypothetical protein M1830_007803 [Pleopsidium flavum]
MAAVSAPHTVGALTPPSSLHGEQNTWKRTVPFNYEQSDQHLPKSHANLQIPSQSKQANRQPFPHQANGTSRTDKASPLDHSQKHRDTAQPRQAPRPDNIPDPGYLAPSRVDALGRKESNNSQTGSEADSLLDLYRRQSASRSRSGQNSMDYGERRGIGGDDVHFDDEDPERSRWIHRDKLAKIESQELQQAGYQLPPRYRPSSRSNSGRERGMGEYRNDINGDNSILSQEGRNEKRQRVASPIPADEEDDDDEAPSFDLRTPEEIAADPYEEGEPPQIYRQTGLRASSSRIPLSTSSPVPIPQDYIERNTPLPRKRGYSGGWSGGDDDCLMYSKRGSRSHSVGSQNLLDDGGPYHRTPTPASRPVSRSMAQASPGKAKVPGKLAPVSGARKISAANRIASGPQNSRSQPNANRNSPGQRPGTRSGESRPTSAINRPEGDPPWLATMYKPDPRLPPDQQILPTHAKRLQQEQWEKEGKYGSTFDREFTPLAIHTHNGLQPPLPVVGDLRPDRKEAEPTAWPLRTNAMSPTLSNSRPGTGGTEHGGYSTIPKVQSPPPSGSPKKVQQLMRLQDPPKEQRGKKDGCGCCIVM